LAGRRPLPVVLQREGAGRHRGGAAAPLRRRDAREGSPLSVVPGRHLRSQLRDGARQPVTLHRGSAADAAVAAARRRGRGARVIRPATAGSGPRPLTWRGRRAQYGRTVECDLVIAGGLVVDGTGTPGVPGDVAIRDGRVAAVGRVDGRAAETID